MHINRRRFLGITGAGTLGATLSMFGPAPQARAAGPPALKTLRATESTTICPYCGVGCGLICSVVDGKLVSIEGDPDHPINEGSLCSKGMALYQIADNERRLAKVQYRAPGSDRWEEKDWDWAMKRIAQRVKATRDATFVTAEDGNIVNRTDGIACLGGAALDNEECYLYTKFARSLGVTWLEHQARI